MCLNYICEMVNTVMTEYGQWSCILLIFFKVSSILNTVIYGIPLFYYAKAIARLFVFTRNFFCLRSFPFQAVYFLELFLGFLIAV